MMIKRWMLILVIVLMASSTQITYASIATEVVIERFVYDGQVANDLDEYVKICNISPGTIDLSNNGSNPWLIGDAETLADTSEGLYELQGTLNPGGCFIIALQGNSFNAVWRFHPDYEFSSTTSPAPNLTKRAGFGTWGLNNSGGDNITLWRYDFTSSSYVKHDEAAYGTTAANYSDVGLSTTVPYQIACGTPTHCAIRRSSVSADTDNMAADFNNVSSPLTVTFGTFTATANGSASFAVLPALAMISVAFLVILRRRSRAA
jgi:hypothetical protein